MLKPLLAADIRSRVIAEWHSKQTKLPELFCWKALSFLTGVLGILPLIASSGPQKQSPSPCHTFPMGCGAEGATKLQAAGLMLNLVRVTGERLNIKVCSVLPNIGPIFFFFFYSIAFEFVLMSSFFPFKLFLEPCDEGAAGTDDP